MVAAVLEHHPTSSDVKQRWAALLTFVALMALSVMSLQYARFLAHAQGDPGRAADSRTIERPSSPPTAAHPGPTRQPQGPKPPNDHPPTARSSAPDPPTQLAMGPTPNVLAIESRPFRLSRNQLPPRFRQYETKRFVVLSDAEVSWTRHQAERLERAHHQFHRWCKRMDLQPKPIRHKLVAVFFADRDDYVSFAEEYENVTEPWMCGFYSPANDRLVFYDIETSPDLINARSQLQRMHEHINIIRYGPAHHHANVAPDENVHRSDSLERLRDYHEKQQERIEKYIEQMSAATTLHEAIHQLLFHTRIQSPYVQYPLWVSEGLATAFETDTPRNAFGPGFEYEPRRQRFREHLQNDNLIPLEEFVTIVRPPNDRDGVDVLYHQSYALMTYLNRYHDDALLTYLKRMGDRRPGALSADQHRAVFEQCFGDISRLENQWLVHERASLD